MKKNHNFKLGFFLLLLLLGCSQAKYTSNNINISLGSGGGFTGMYDGYYIDTLGNISTWNGRTFTLSSLVHVGKLTPKELEDLNTKINEIDILNIQHRKSGNISSSISFSSDSHKHTISWSGFEPDENVPNQVREFYYFIKKLINDSITK